jgi:uncharacterized RDD family membrane protein YckC
VTSPTDPNHPAGSDADEGAKSPFPPIDPTSTGYGQPAAGWPTGATLATWPQRAQSALIDWFGPSLIAALFRTTDVYWLLGTAAFAWAIYNRYLEGTTTQSTGRRIAGTRLVRVSDGQPIGAALAIVRHFVHIIDAIIVFLGFLLPLIDAKKQTIADKIMGTLVVRAHVPARAR